MRRGKNCHIDVIAGFDVFQYWSCGDDTRRNRFDCFQKFFPPGDELDGRGIGCHADGKAGANRIANDIRDDAKIGRIIGDLIEEHHR